MWLFEGWMGGFVWWMGELGGMDVWEVFSWMCCCFGEMEIKMERNGNRNRDRNRSRVEKNEKKKE